jgi:hypothetical protein
MSHFKSIRKARDLIARIDSVIDSATPALNPCNEVDVQILDELTDMKCEQHIIIEMHIKVVKENCDKDKITYKEEHDRMIATLELI